MLPVLLFASVIAIMLPINISFAIPVAAVITIGFCAVIFLSSPVIEITESSLKCKGAEIEKQFLGQIQVISKSESFEELGRKLDARAWLSIQASVKTMVKIEVSDPEDPTPYWLVTTRNPEAVIQALRAS